MEGGLVTGMWFHAHCVGGGGGRGVRIRSLSGPYFSTFGLNAGRDGSRCGQFVYTVFINSNYDIPLVAKKEFGKMSKSPKML